MLKVDDLNVFVGKKKIIHDSAFRVNKGQIVGLIGPNGAGKTTIMKAILGLMKFTGSITFDGEDISETNHNALKQIGALIEHPAIYPFMTGYQNLKLYSTDETDLKQLISILQMDDFISLKSKDYSLGMKQKLGIALSLLNRPKLIILDEPMNGLDIESTILVRNTIKNYAQQGSSFLISSHILSELQKVMTNVMLIAEGRLIVDEPMDKFYQLNYQNFKLLTEDVHKTISLLQEANISFSQSENYLILDHEDSHLVQDLLYLHHIHLQELTPIGENFEDLVVGLLEEKRE